MGASRTLVKFFGSIHKNADVIVEHFRLHAQYASLTVRYVRSDVRFFFLASCVTLMLAALGAVSAVVSVTLWIALPAPQISRPWLLILVPAVMFAGAVSVGFAAMLRSPMTRLRRIVSVWSDDVKAVLDGGAPSSAAGSASVSRNDSSSSSKVAPTASASATHE